MAYQHCSNPLGSSGTDAGRVAAEPASRARLTLALVYSHDAGNAEAPARLADESARAGRAASRWLARAWHPCRAWRPVHRDSRQHLQESRHSGTKILSRTDSGSHARIAQAWRSRGQSSGDRPDLPAARAYLKRSRQPRGTREFNDLSTCRAWRQRTMPKAPRIPADAAALDHER